MIPITSPEEMRRVDEAAPEPVEELIDRAGGALARAAVDMLGGTYGRRVVVVAGPGNNGADGRAAARRLRTAGVRVVEVDALDSPPSLPHADLIIDAAFGTSLNRDHRAPEVGAVPVLAADIPSGIDGLTGIERGRAMRAQRTVTFQALKPGLLLEPGRAAAGRVEVVDIGLDVSAVAAHLVESTDVVAWVPSRPVEAHKWQSAVWVIAGSPGMTGAAHLAARAALRSGAGYVRLSTPGGAGHHQAPTEAVQVALPGQGWGAALDGGKVAAAVVGPGLGGDQGSEVDAALAALPCPVVLDGDGLTSASAAAIRARSGSTVLTPHDGEFRVLTGAVPDQDRFAAARELAASTGATVLLKGPVTVVADPTGRTLVAAAADQRLATAGSGDVLAGIIGALLARGTLPLEAAAAAAHVHGLAARRGPRIGLVAGDLPDLVADTLSRLT
jgi:NAD(P)H-hydrate epimerase